MQLGSLRAPEVDTVGRPQRSVPKSQRPHAPLRRSRAVHVCEQISVWLYVPDSAKDHRHEEQWNKNAVIVYMHDWHSIFRDFDPGTLPRNAGISRLHMMVP
jgi:hypothetical protein